MICREALVGAAGQTAPTNGYESPLKIDSVVVSVGAKWHEEYMCQGVESDLVVLGTLDVFARMFSRRSS